MYRWTAWAQHISSFMISRAVADSSRTLLRPSKHMWQRCSQSGFTAPLILSSPSSCWQRVDSTPWPHQIGAAKGLEWSTPTTPCTTKFLVSQSPCCCWWGVPHLALTWIGQVEEGVGCTLRESTSCGRGRPPWAYPVKHGTGN